MIGSLIRNPALPGAGSVATAKAVGVYAVTRHPMMWSFAIWGIAHVLVWPISKNVVLSGAMIVLALVGAVMQDRKKARLDPSGWPVWESRTSYWPFVAIARGRARFGSFGLPATLGGLVLWLVGSWAHLPATGWAAGIWRWIG